MDASLESIGLWVAVVSILVAYMVPALPYWAWVVLVAVGGLSIAYIVFSAVARLRGVLGAARSKKSTDDAKSKNRQVGSAESTEHL
jgi:hypothetical protein